MKKRAIGLVGCFLFAFALAAQGFRIDSLKKVLQVQPEDTSRIITLNELGWQLLNKGDYLEALESLGESLTLSEKLSYKKGAALAHNIIGLVHMERGYYPEAATSLLRVLKIADEIGHKRYMAYAYGNLGLIYYEQGNYQESMASQLKALEVFRVLGSKQGIANCYGNIGDCLLRMKSYPEALENYFISVKMLEELADSVGMSTIYSHIGLACFEQSAGLNGGDRSRLFSEAVKYYFLSLKIRDIIGDKRGIIESYLQIANVNLKMKMFPEAEAYQDRALTLALQIGNKNFIRDSYLFRARLDSTRGQFDSAYRSYKKYILYRDSLMNDENTRKIVQAQMQYEFDRKEASQKAEQNKRDALAAQEKQRQQIVIYSISSVLLLVLLLAVFIYRSYRQKQIANIAITLQKQVIEQKQKEILDSIHYAKRIQQSRMPSERYIERKLSELRLRKDG